MDLEMNNNQAFESIENVKTITVPTRQAAYYLNRSQQTMRNWAMRGNGAIIPLKINGRLAWPVKEIKILLGIKE